MRTRAVVLAGALVVTAGALAASRLAPVDGAPSIANVQWVEQPDTRTPVEAIPWCADSSGHSVVYPCKWDARERSPSPAWDSQAALVGVWVRNPPGCQGLIRRVKTSEDNSVAWACYHAPGG